MKPAKEIEIIGPKKPLPNDINAEVSVLGSCLQSKEAVIVVMEMIESEEAFYKSDHRRIFMAITRLNEENVPIDIISVGQYLERQNQLEQIGGNYYLTELVARVPSAANVDYHCGIMIECYRLRRLYEIGYSIANEVIEGHERSKEIISKYGEMLFALQREEKGEGWTTLNEEALKAVVKVEIAMSSPEKILGIPTGFIDVDEMVGGLQKTDLIVFGGRPSQGKTAYMMNCSHNIADWGGYPLIFSLEMSKYSLALRELAGHGKINSLKLRTLKYFGQEDFNTLKQVVEKNSDVWQNIYLDDAAYMTPFRMVTRIKRLLIKKPEIIDKAVCFVDYTQLLAPGKKFDNRENEVAWISSRLKNMAKYFNIPVVAFSALNRSAENNPDHIPQLHNLRESGAIEQDADIVLFLVRPEKYDEHDRPGIAMIIIGKHRNGPTGTVLQQFTKEYMVFSNLAKAIHDENRTNGKSNGKEWHEDYEPREVVYIGSDGKRMDAPF